MHLLFFISFPCCATSVLLLEALEEAPPAVPLRGLRGLGHCIIITPDIHPVLRILLSNLHKSYPQSTSYHIHFVNKIRWFLTWSPDTLLATDSFLFVKRHLSQKWTVLPVFRLGMFHSKGIQSIYLVAFARTVHIHLLHAIL